MNRCWIEVSGPALRRNVDVLRGRLGGGRSIMAVVKANAYGHGMEEVVSALLNRVEFFGVANLDEAARIEKFVGPGRIMLLSPPLPSERAEVVMSGFCTWLSSLEEAREYDIVARRLAKRYRVHVKLDSGMGRIGFPSPLWPEALSQLSKLSGLEITGLATHLPVSDEDDDFTEAQLASFASEIKTWRSVFPSIMHIHAANSAGALGWPLWGGNLVRVGLAVYGVDPRRELQDQLQPALRWKTAISLVRDLPAGHGVSYGRTFVSRRPMKVAVLAAGYGDGYPRHLSLRGTSVWVHGQRSPLLGRVTMDQIMVDVSLVPGVRAGDVAELIGGEGPEAVTAEELAGRAQTIPWEIFTNIQTRVKRVGVDLEEPSVKTLFKPSALRL